MLLLGRVISMAVNFAVHVLIVRHLSRADYGSFAYALSIVTFMATVVTFGLDRAVTRFIAIYDERGEPGKVLGTLIMVVGTVAVFGAIATVLVVAGRDAIATALLDDREAGVVLVLLIGLAPIQALDTIAIGMFAVLERPGAIFWRKYALAPVLRLTTVGALILFDAGTRFLAVGYVLTGATGVLIYSGLLISLLRRRGFLTRETFAQLDVPVREVLSFTVPLLTIDLVYAVMNTSDVIMLGWFRDAHEIAGLRTVQKVAKLSQFAMGSFGVMFMPLVSRLFARNDEEGMGSLYRQTAMWMTVVSFPTFIASFALARPLTVALFGAEYADAAPLLALLAVGYYVQVAMGMNHLTLRAVGAVRSLVVLNVGSAVANIILNLALIPTFGALGAAIATMSARVFFNLLMQLGLRRATGIHLLERATVRVYLVAAAAAAAVYAFQQLVDPSLVVGLGAGALGTFVLLMQARPTLSISTTFPEIMRFRIARALVGDAST